MMHKEITCMFDLLNPFNVKVTPLTPSRLRVVFGLIMQLLLLRALLLDLRLE